MKLAKDIFKDIVENFEMIDRQIKELDSMYIMLNSEFNETYHEIETANFNASEGFKYAKKLQTILQTRRIVKTELQALKEIKKNFPLSAHGGDIKSKVYTDKKSKCEYAIRRFDYTNNDWDENFKVSPEDIAI
jgi:RNAse (barnase) inhibitor barstar